MSVLTRIRPRPSEIEPLRELTRWFENSGLPNTPLLDYWYKPGISDTFSAYMRTTSGGSGFISSTAHATKGFIYLGSAQTSAFNETLQRVGLNVAAPAAKLDMLVGAPVGQAARPTIATALHPGIGWGPVGAATLVDCIDDTDADLGGTDYARYSPGGGFNDTLTITFGSITNPGVTSGFAIKLTMRSSGGYPSIMRVDLSNVSGAPVFSTDEYGGDGYVGSPVSQGNVTAGLVQYTRVLTAGEVALIDYASTLRVSIYNSGLPGSGFWDVAQVEMVAPAVGGGSAETLQKWSTPSYENLLDFAADGSGGATLDIDFSGDAPLRISAGGGTSGLRFLTSSTNGRIEVGTSAQANMNLVLSGARDGTGTLLTSKFASTVAAGTLTVQGGTPTSVKYFGSVDTTGLGVWRQIAYSELTGTPAVGAATTEPYVTIGNTAGLSAERALTGTARITIADGGVNSTATVDLVIPVTVPSGGTGITSGTSGGIPYFSGTTTIASSAALTASRIVLGGGAGVSPTIVGSLGTTTQVLHGNAAGAPTFGAIVDADLPATLTANARVAVRKNSTGSDFTRRRVNLIEGSNITLTVADDSGNEEVDVTIAGTATSTSLLSERATQVIAAGTTMVVTDGTPVTPFTTASGSDVTSTAVPFIAAGRDGQFIIIRNDNGTDAAGLILRDTNFFANSGIRLDADQFTFAGTSTAGFVYSATMSAWVFQWYKKLKHYTGAIASFTVDASGALTHEWGDGSTTNDTAPVFALTYSGIPTAASVTITASPDAGYPLTLTTPFLAGTGAVYFRSSTRNGTRTFRASATVNGSAVTSDVIVTYRAPNYSGVIAQSTNITSAQAVALTHTLDTDPYNTYSSIAATGASDRIWFGFVTADATLDTTLFFAIAGARAKFSLKNNPLSVTSSFLKVQNYDTYCSDIAQLGTVTVVVQSTRPPNFRYVGRVNQNTQLSEAQIEALSNSDLTESPNGTFLSVAGFGATSYMWFCVSDTNIAAPTHYGLSQSAGAGGYEEAAFTAMTVTSVTNVYGFVENYKNIHSNTTGLQAITINAVQNATWSLKTQAAAFNYRFFVGPSTATAISSAQILAIDDTSSGVSSVAAASLAGTYAVTVSGSNYLWVCHEDVSTPDIGTIKDVSTGFAIAGSYRTDVNPHTNDFGVGSLTYRVWRSDNPAIFPTGGNVVIT